MALEDVARAHYTQQQALTTRITAAVGGVWAQLDPGNLKGSWTSLSLAEQLFVLIATYQVAAANAAPGYVAAALAEQGAESDPAGELIPQSVAGIASDGRPLESLVVQPLIGTLTAIGKGAQVGDALRMGGSALEAIAETQVADANRAATHVMMGADRRVTGWIRMLVPPSCGRCAVLAGRRYRWSAGFRRHPRLPITLRLPTHPRGRGQGRRSPDRPRRLLPVPERCQPRALLRRRCRVGDQGRR